MGKIAQHVGREYHLKDVCGQDWIFSRWDRGVWRDLTERARKVLPNPFDVALDNIEKIAAKDAEIIRQLKIKDAEEELAAKVSGRTPVLLARSYQEMHTKILLEAKQAASCYLTPADPAMQSFIESMEGASYLFYLLLRPKHPEIDEDDAFAIFMAIKDRTSEAGKVVPAINPGTGKPNANAGKPLPLAADIFDAVSGMSPPQASGKNELALAG